MRIIDLNKISERKLNLLFTRPAQHNNKIYTQVKSILEDVKKYGDKSVINYAKKFDNYSGNKLKVSKTEIEAAAKNVTPQLKRAIKTAYGNIKKFHEYQFPMGCAVETQKGVLCGRKFVPIENVGIYIPGGSAVLISTILMLAIPAKLAGCKRIILCSPCGGDKLNPAVLYTAKLCGISEIFKVGGAQAIGMLAYGTKTIDKVDKIFGPGNQYVTSAKTQVSIDPLGCAIDMPAGPSEVLVIADKFANPIFVASDLLSQAEHGADSQVILITDNEGTAQKVKVEIDLQLKKLPRRKIAEAALKKSFILVVPNLDLAFKLSNEYAPEHLILNIKNAEKLFSKIKNAGSVFIGQYSPESAGDYSSGTNHSLPTYGYAKSYGGVSVEMFMKSITFQKLTKEGLQNISDSVITLAETEKLEAHANAVKVRL